MTTDQHTSAWAGIVLPASPAKKPRRMIHFLGSLPPDLRGRDVDTMRWFLDQAGPLLLTLPCDRDPRWATNWLFGLDESTESPLTRIRGGAATDYDNYPQYAVARGRRLTAGDVSLHRAQEVAEFFDARAQLEGELPPCQVSLPSPLDLAYIVLRGAGTVQMLANLSTFRQALIDDIVLIHQQWGEKVVFQLESPAALILLQEVPRQLRAAVEKLLGQVVARRCAPLLDAAARVAGPLLRRMLVRVVAAQFAAVIAAVPTPVRFLLHLCNGDLDGKPAVIPDDLDAPVWIVQSLRRKLRRARRRMPLVHLACCTSETGPSAEPRFYTALARLPRSVGVILGIAHERHAQKSLLALSIAEEQLGRPVHAVSAACGYGRGTVERAQESAALLRTLAGQRPVGERPHTADHVPITRPAAGQ